MLPTPLAFSFGTHNASGQTRAPLGWIGPRMLVARSRADPRPTLAACGCKKYTLTPSGPTAIGRATAAPFPLRDRTTRPQARLPRPVAERARTRGAGYLVCDKDHKSPIFALLYEHTRPYSLCALQSTEGALRATRALRADACMWHGAQCILRTAFRIMYGCACARARAQMQTRAQTVRDC